MYTLVPQESKKSTNGYVLALYALQQLRVIHLLIILKIKGIELSSRAKFQPSAMIKSHSLVAQKRLFNEYTLCIILTYIQVTVLLVVQRLLKFQSK